MYVLIVPHNFDLTRTNSMQGAARVTTTAIPQDVSTNTVLDALRTRLRPVPTPQPLLARSLAP